ncbi:MAG TPA: hypothetical protein VN809_07720 [Telmatospirillum sp.]|nr:hypothetical protein [Telmatospirillum sp.]
MEKLTTVKADKGDHVHAGDQEIAYQFVDLDRLKADFLADVKEWLNAHGNS